MARLYGAFVTSYVGKIVLDVIATDPSDIARVYTELNAKIVCLQGLTDMSVNRTLEDTLPVAQMGHVHTNCPCFATFPENPPPITNHRRKFYRYSIPGHRISVRTPQSMLRATSASAILWKRTFGFLSSSAQWTLFESDRQQSTLQVSLRTSTRSRYLRRMGNCISDDLVNSEMHLPSNQWITVRHSMWYQIKSVTLSSLPRHYNSVTWTHRRRSLHQNKESS